MSKAAHQAKKRGIPIVIDPVGVGATKYRTKTARELIHDVPPAIIRGNASEIMALFDAKGSTKGVDSTDSSSSAISAAKDINKKFGSIVCISGETDYIVNRDDITIVKNGQSLMTRVTGLGCTATALCGAFAALNSDYAFATAQAMTVMGIAGEIAAERAQGPGSLQMHFIDALYRLSEEDIHRYIKIGVS